MAKYYVIIFSLSLILAYFIYKDSFSDEILKNTKIEDEHKVFIKPHYEHDHDKRKRSSSDEKKISVDQNQSIIKPSYQDIIRDKLCVEKNDHHPCNIDLNLDLTTALIDSNLNAARIEEIGLVLQSKNYKEVMNSISGLSSDNIMKSENLNQRARDLSSSMGLNIESNISCNEKLCAAEFRIDNNENWNKFKTDFFKGDAAGNIFILPAQEESNTLRVILVLDENLPVLRRGD